MRQKFLTMVGMFAFLLMTIMLAPHQAMAQSNAQTISQQCTSGTFDQQVGNNRAQFQRNIMNQVHNVNTLYPIIKAKDKCLDDMNKILMALSGMGPSSIGTLIANALVQAVAAEILSLCNQIMNMVTQAESALARTLTICIPQIPFLNLNLPSFQGTPCLGGLMGKGGQQFPLTTNFPQSQQGQPTQTQFQSGGNGQ